MILPGILSSQISGHLFTLTGSYDALATVTVPSGGASSITFSAIPQTGYSHLQIRAMALRSTSGNSIRAQFNGDTASNYNGHALFGDGGSASASSSGSINGMNLSYTSSTTYPSALVADVLDYSATTKNKVVRSLTGGDNNGSGYILMYSGLWQSTSAINSITIYPESGSFSQYAQFSLYGIR
jgi:hypothetical protein